WLAGLGRARAGLAGRRRPPRRLAPPHPRAGGRLAAVGDGRRPAQPAAHRPPARCLRPGAAGGGGTVTVDRAGRITDEAIARLRARIGVAEPHPRPPHYREITVDVFRHVAEAYGDDNPLWCDPSYGPRTRWQSPIAPPPLVGGDTLVGEDEVTELDPDTAALLKGDPLRGVHAFYSASAREWWAPLRPGRRVRRRNALVAVLDKPS